MPPAPPQGVTQGMNIARRAALVEAMRLLAPTAARYEPHAKRYKMLEDELKHIDEQVNRSQQELRQTAELGLHQAQLGLERERIGISRQNLALQQQQERRQAAEWTVKQRELTLDIEKKLREKQGVLTETERNTTARAIQDQAEKEPAIRMWNYARGAWQGIQEGYATNTPAGDLLLINGFNAIIQPTPNAVTMGEVQNVEQGQALLRRWFNVPEKFFEGTRLVEPYRTQLLDTSQRLATRRAQAADDAALAKIAPQAQRAGVPLEQIHPFAMRQLGEPPVPSITLAPDQRSKALKALEETGFTK